MMRLIMQRGRMMHMMAIWVQTGFYRPGSAGIEEKKTDKNSADPLHKNRLFLPDNVPFFKRQLEDTASSTAIVRQAPVLRGPNTTRRRCQVEILFS